MKARYTKAEPLSRRALTIVEKNLAPDRPNIVKTLNNLARLYEKLGKREEAAAPSGRDRHRKSLSFALDPHLGGASAVRRLTEKQ